MGVGLSFCFMFVLSHVAECQGLNPEFSESAILKRLESLEVELTSLKKQLKDARSSQEGDKQKEKNSSSSISSISKASDMSSATSSPSSMFVPQFDDTKLDPGLFGITYRNGGTVTDSMKIGAYGETKFGRTESSKGWENGFDATRIVLLGTYPIAEDILFNTEIEFEHGGIAKEADDKLEGAVEVEQLFVDFKVNDHLSWRSPGVDIVPVGYVGLFHEPTQFYSVNRPALYRGIIPSTWFAPATSIYGKVVDGLTYQFQVSASVEDIGTSGDEIPSDGYDAGISGTEALGLSRATISDRGQMSDEFGYAARLAYSPMTVPGLSGSTSVYGTADTTPKGGYGTNPNGSLRSLGSSSLLMVDSEMRYRIPKSDLELRGEVVHVSFGSPENLRANNNNDSQDNVGDSMYGYSLEAAYHVPLSSSATTPWELVPFYRYTYQNFQTSGFMGSDLNEPTGQGEQQLHTFGFALFPTPKLVLKLNYETVLDEAENSPKNDSFLGSVGFFF